MWNPIGSIEPNALHEIQLARLLCVLYPASTKLFLFSLSIILSFPRIVTCHTNDDRTESSF